MKRMEPLPVVFYKEEGSGNEPVRKWLQSLTKEDRKRIGDDIKTIEIGWPLGMPLVRNLGDGLWEIRSHILHGIARIIFIVWKEEIVLLNAFVKKSQKTPQEELDVARKRAKKYKQNEGL
jgi:phage-related protein